MSTSISLPRSPPGLFFRWSGRKALAASLVVLVVMALASCGSTPSKDSPLLAAASAGRAEEVAKLLDRGANPNSARPDGQTALHVAALGGQIEIVKALLQRKANANARDKQGVTPLMLAAAGRDSSEIVRLLATSGADVNARSIAGFSALHDAAASGHKDAVEALLQNFADVNVKGSANARTPLHNAVDSHNVDIVNMLLSKGSEVNARINVSIKGVVNRFDGATPLHLAAWNGDRPIAEALLAHGADVNISDKHGLTALHYAATADKAELAALLLDHGADAGIHQEVTEHRVARAGEFRTGDTALHKAAMFERPAVIVTLLEHHAERDSDNASGQTPLGLAIACGNLQATQVLLDGGATVAGKIDASDQALLKAVVAERSAFASARAGTYPAAASLYDAAAAAYERAASSYQHDATMTSIKRGLALALVGGTMAAAGAAQAHVQQTQMNQVVALRTAQSQGTGTAGYVQNLAALNRSPSIPATGVFAVSAPTEAPIGFDDVQRKRALAQTLASRSQEIASCVRTPTIQGPDECLKSKGLAL